MAKNGFFKFLDWIDGLEITTSEGFALLQLCRNTNYETMQCWKSLNTLSRQIHTSKSQTVRLLKQLEEKGLIEKHVRHGQGKGTARLSTSYTIKCSTATVHHSGTATVPHTLSEVPPRDISEVPPRYMTNNEVPPRDISDVPNEQSDVPNTASEVPPRVPNSYIPNITPNITPNARDARRDCIDKKEECQEGNKKNILDEYEALQPETTRLLWKQKEAEWQQRRASQQGQPQSIKSVLAGLRAAPGNGEMREEVG